MRSALQMQSVKDLSVIHDAKVAPQLKSHNNKSQFSAKYTRKRLQARIYHSITAIYTPIYINFHILLH